ncbi:MAG: transposase [Candidatus Pacebacteria bacterium]|jgi:putative transposase|nr:transposase [Candidatus Paceibacterota bacterium]
MSTIKVEPFTVGNYVHVYNRGNKKATIFLSKSDYWRFLWTLRFFNDQRNIAEFARCLSNLVDEQKEVLRQLRGLQGSDPCRKNYFDGHNTFEWRSEWGDQQPLTEIISYHLSPNHFHLLLKEIIPGGISKFMKKIGGGYTVYSNLKNNESGKVFQGKYRGKTVNDEKYLQYLDAYIQVFNAFELFDGGIANALNNFDEAFKFALEYPFSSLGEAYGNRNLRIVVRNYFSEIFVDRNSYKEFCREAIIARNNRDYLGKLAID